MAPQYGTIETTLGTPTSSRKAYLQLSASGPDHSTVQAIKACGAMAINDGHRGSCCCRHLNLVQSRIFPTAFTSNGA